MQMRAMGPPGFKPAALAAVDAYIKAFYLPWDDLPKWCQVRSESGGMSKQLFISRVPYTFTHKIHRLANTRLQQPARAYTHIHNRPHRSQS